MPLKTGDTIPSFILKDQNGNDFDVLTKEGKLIMRYNTIKAAKHIEKALSILKKLD